MAIQSFTQSWMDLPSNSRIPPKPVVWVPSKTDLFPDPAGLVCTSLGIVLAVDRLLRGEGLCRSWCNDVPNMVPFPRGMIFPWFGCSSTLFGTSDNT